ncbi:hypothetical protein AB0D78_15590 [Streptomyces avermitilis]|uniref:hypothetical protein n=1 Tax=Streptomyces avermitilis TaxID=33903 RepID=UPI0033EF4796
MQAGHSCRDQALGLITTGLLAVHGHHLHAFTATATATLLVVDAWFDTMTAAPGGNQLPAVAMAFGAELPLAVMCVVLAVRGRRTAHRVRRTSQGNKPR